MVWQDIIRIQIADARGVSERAKQLFGKDGAQVGLVLLAIAKQGMNYPTFEISPGDAIEEKTNSLEV